MGGILWKGARIRTVIRDKYIVRLGFLRRIQGRSIGGGESLLSLAVGEMPWTSFAERDGDDGHAWLQGVRSDLSRVEVEVAYPLEEELGIGGLEGFVRGWMRLEEQSSPGAWEEPWNAGRLEIGIRHARVLDERDW